jgi:hypothetical protein
MTPSKGTSGRARRALSMLTGAQPGLGRRAFDNCFEMGDGAQVGAIIAGLLEGDEGLARRVWCGWRSYRPAYRGDYPTTVSARDFLSPEWTAIIIRHGIATLADVPDRYGTRGKVAMALDKQEPTREQQVLKLRASSPMRAPMPQHDASGLALFGAANEPRLI